MKIALVHDYLGEFGGAERVLLALSEIWPDAPIYTAFYRKEAAFAKLKDKNIKVSWAHHIPFFNTKLHSPFRFLAPFIWNSFDFSEYDVVITSSSWYVTKGMRKGDAIEICYCHTPPRYLYGYPTSVNWQKYWLIRFYAAIVNHFMRIYDFNAAQKVDYFIANSKNVKKRIEKFYRREATVIYPPVEVSTKFQVPSSKQIQNLPDRQSGSKFKILNSDYYLVVSRIVGGKGLGLAVKAANKLGFNLKVVGQAAGYGSEFERIKKIAKKNVEFLGFVEDSELAKLYAGAKGFLALAEDEDFGITPVEAMLAGTPVIAYRGGGYVESVVSGKTGIFFSEQNVDSLVSAIKTFGKRKWDRRQIAKYAQKFSKDRFKREIRDFVESKLT